MSTPVFDVVHEFSGRGISAVPIIDEEGIVVNLYETVDVIVRHTLHPTNDCQRTNLTRTPRLLRSVDVGAIGGLSILGLDDRSGAYRALPGLPWRCHLHRFRLARNTSSTDQQAPGASAGRRRGGRGREARREEGSPARHHHANRCVAIYRWHYPTARADRTPGNKASYPSTTPRRLPTRTVPTTKADATTGVGDH